MQSMIGKFNLSKGTENNFVTFSTGDIVYYEDTTELNKTIIGAEIYKYDRSKFLNSVQQQLMYFKNLNVYQIDENGVKNVFHIAPRIIYEDDDIIMSDNYFYSKPHIVINGVNYGFIDYERIFETEQIHSNIGIKCKLSITDKLPDGTIVETQEGLQVVPSRESIINDSPYTRKHLTNKINIVADKATEIINKALNEKDFVKWINAAQAIVTGYSSDEVLKRMKQFVGSEKITPLYSEDKSIKFSYVPTSFFFGMDVKTVRAVSEWVKGKHVQKIKREPLVSWSGFTSDHIYVRVEDHGNLKDKYLLSTLNGRYYTTIKLRDYDVVEEEYINKFSNASISELNKHRQRCKEAYEIAEKIFDLISSSKSSKDYDKIEVPEDWKKNNNINEDEEVAEDGTVVTQIPRLSPAEMRRLNSKTVCFSLRVDNTYTNQLIWDKQEPTIDFIENTPSDCKIIWGLGKDEKLIQLAGLILHGSNNGNVRHSVNNANLKLYKVADANKAPFKKSHAINYIRRFFKSIDKGDNIKVGMELKNWWTAKLIYDKLSDFQFMINYKSINKEIYDLYQEVASYCETYYKPLNDRYSNYLSENKELYNSFIRDCEKITEFQLFVNSHTDSELIKQKSMELFDTDFMKGAVGVDLVMYNKLMTLVEYAAPVKDLFNEVACLVSPKAHIKPSTEMFIHEILQLKDLSKFEVPEFKKEEDKEEEVVLEEN